MDRIYSEANRPGPDSVYLAFNRIYQIIDILEGIANELDIVNKRKKRYDYSRKLRTIVSNIKIIKISIDNFGIDDNEYIVPKSQPLIDSAE